MAKTRPAYRQNANAAARERRQDAYANVALGAAAAITVWATYYPADSTAVEQGHALGLTCSLMGWGLVAAIMLRIRPALDARNPAWWMNVSALGLAAWVFTAAWVTAGVFSTSPPEVGGDMRAATNEAWWWIAAAGFLVVMRRLMANTDRLRAVFGLMLGLGTLLAVHSLHQYFVSLPETMQEYLRDPDGTLAMIGVNAPPGSAARMIYENRLRDGGPTATFALANSLAGPLAMIATLCGGCLTCLLTGFLSSGNSQRVARRVADSEDRGAGENVGAGEDRGAGEDDADFVERRATRARSLALSVMLSAVLCLLIVALLTTGSRSGFLSVVVVGMAFAVSSIWTRTGRQVRTVLAIAMGLGSVAVVVWWQAGAESRFGQGAAGARQTIELRLQYWASTLAMVFDHPWFGAGPGNFQLVYQKYRDVNAHEMIAEPHNFFVETLACGGWIAAMLLAMCMIAGGMVYRRNMSLHTASEPDSVAPDLAPENRSTRSGFLQQNNESLVGLAVAIGAFVGLLAVWYAGIFGGALPDFEAHQYGIPAAILVMATWSMASPSGAMGFTNRQCRRIAAAAAVCGFVHLCFSGGWTLPGVSLLLIWLVGVSTGVPANARVAEHSPESRAPQEMKSSIPRLGSGLVWVALILVMVFFSLRPVARTRAAMAEAATLLGTHRVGHAEAVLRSALQNDPLAQDAAVWLAEIENRKWLQHFTSPATASPRESRDADEAISEAISRAGNHPTLLRAIAELLVHRYQVGGRTDDLVRAQQIFSKVMVLSPTQESTVAQQSEIVRELTAQGRHVDGDSATHLAARAEELAASGEMVTRKLELQPILVARKLGNAALGQPVRAPAAELLRDQPDGPK